MKREIIITILLLLFSNATIANDKGKIESDTITIEGIVVSSLGERLDGVLITFPYQHRGAVTSSQGKFTINIPKGEALTFTYPRYYKEIVKPKSKYIKVVLEPYTSPIDNSLVTIGYGTRKKLDLTYSTTTISAHQLSFVSSLPLSKAIMGVSSSVIVDRSNVYNPFDIPKIAIRGVTSLTDSNPLILVDDIEIENIDMIPTSAVKSITILKDGASQAIFGSKGSNGAILITTENNQISKLKVTYQANYSITSTNSSIERISGKEYSEIYNNLTQGDKTPNLSTISSNNWEERLYQKAAQHNHSLFIKGGSEKINHHTSLRYESGEGIVKKSNHSGLSATTSVQTTITRWLKWGINGNYYQYTATEPYCITSPNNQIEKGVREAIYTCATTAPNSEKSPIFPHFNKSKSSLNSSTYLIFSPHNTTNIRTEISYNSPNVYNSLPHTITYKGYGNFSGYVSKYISLDAMAGYTSEQGNNRTREHSIMARALFTINKRYLIEGSVNGEKNNFLPQNRWSYYPSLSTAWRITNEEFTHLNKNIINHLKIRSSLGKSANYSLLYNTIPSQQSGYTWDLGVDLIIYGSLTFSADYYLSNDKNIAISPTTTASVRNSGVELAANYTKNFNDVELNLSATFSYNNNTITNTNSDTLHYLNNYSYKTNGSIGNFNLYKTLFLHTTYESINKYYYNNLANDKHICTPYADFAISDENLNQMVDNGDKIAIGNEIAKINYSFSGGVNWKGVYINCILNGKAGVNRYFSSTLWGEFNGDNGNPSTFWLKGLTDKNNSSTPHPSLPHSSNSNPSEYPSTYFLVNSSYLRLSSLSVGYTIPANITSKIAISSLKIYYSGQNLFTWHNMPLDVNPEAASFSLAPLPSTKVHSFGLSITF